MNKAIFLDRDGTINVDKKYVHNISDFEFIPGVITAMSSLQVAGYMLVIITNQSGIARGYYSEHQIQILNEWLRKTLLTQNILISGIYYCPHHPEASIARYRKDCDCRKPKLGLFYQAVEELAIDLDHSYTIGDRMRDLAICEASGCKGYLIGDIEHPLDLPANIKIKPSLAMAAKSILAAAIQ
jgi:D-glycero-D-manno-heptose 1,7-bisphosphate phosphatase